MRSHSRAAWAATGGRRRDDRRRHAALTAATTGGRSRLADGLLAWYFVVVWGSGFLATKVGLLYAAPFTFLALRFAFGLLCLLPVIMLVRVRWPDTRAALGHVIVAGLLMHAINLSGSHYSQYLGMSAGVVALITATQPLFTAIIAARWMTEPLRPIQWLGVALGLAGVALVVWHKIDIRAISTASLATVAISVAAATAGTLYQRRYCPTADLRSAAFIQFAACVVTLAPLSWLVEGARVVWAWQLLAAIAFLVIFASIFAVSALHTLMRHGEAARVTSIFYLTPIIAVLLEYLMFDVVPTVLSLAGMAVTCVGVALVALPPRRR